MDFNGFDFLSKPIHIKPIAGGTKDAYMEWLPRRMRSAPTHGSSAFVVSLTMTRVMIGVLHPSLKAPIFIVGASGKINTIVY